MAKRTKKKKTKTKSGPKCKKTRRKKTARRSPRKKRAQPKEEAEVKKTADEDQGEEQASLIAAPPIRWYLVSEMGFGIVNENFAAGTTFTVDWEHDVMRCDDSGRTYNNIRDLEIAIRLQKALPVTEDTKDQYENVKQRSQQLAERERRSSEEQRSQHDQEVRSKVIQSDEDLISSIDISSTKRPAKSEKPQQSTPRDVVELIKPRSQEGMEVIHSEGAQEARRVASSTMTSRPEVKNTSSNARADESVLAGKHTWSATKDQGAVRNMVNKRMSNYSIIVDDNGQQIIRGMPVVRDDSSGGTGGSSLNEGQVQHFTPEEMRKRNKQARERAEQLRAKATAAKKRAQSKEQTTDEARNLLPREVEVTNNLMQTLETVPTDDSFTGSEPEQVSEHVGQLLRRRR